MTTAALFRDDATLLHCDAVVTGVEPGGVVLDRTVCYPLGGGQAGDTGWLVAGERRWRVTDTRKSKLQPDAIVHLIDGEDLPAPGLPVQVEVDAERRMAHRRFHTATHLLCALLPYPVDGCSITASAARLDFHTDEPFDRGAIQAGLDRLVAAAHPVTQRWISEAELDASPGLVRSMSVQPPRGLGRIRVIDVQGVDLQPCGGTHVSNTAEIGAVVVTKIEKKSARTRRVVLGFAAPDAGEGAG